MARLGECRSEIFPEYPIAYYSWIVSRLIPMNKTQLRAGSRYLYILQKPYALVPCLSRPVSTHKS